MCSSDLQKDPTIINGNLIIYDETEKIEILSGNMLIIPGNVYHEIEKMDGNGQRISIIVQIQRD